MVVRIFEGNCLDVLRTLPERSVHVCVTSPPYWGLRSYSTQPQIWGGRGDCEHSWASFKRPGTTGGTASAKTCIKCNAWRGELGSEPTPDLFIENLVLIFREVRRVLRNDGTLWVNFGDSYYSAASNQNGIGLHGSVNGGNTEMGRRRALARHATLKQKDLCMMPARLALALQTDGWYLRSAITWCKTAPMPESVTDRPTNATEMIYLLSKQRSYYYDMDAIRVEQKCEWWNKAVNVDGTKIVADRKDGGNLQGTGNTAGRNLWNYWVLPPEQFNGAHFAAFPTEIPRRAILAGTSARGACAKCGASHVRVLKGTAWQPSCAHGADVTACTVLDPFFGAGTTGLVADQLGRDCIGIELNPDYAEIARQRIVSDAPMFTTVDGKSVQLDLFGECIK